jgi:TM2 domain-containing membrane protein YozV
MMVACPACGGQFQMPGEAVPHFPAPPQFDATDPRYPVSYRPQKDPAVAALLSFVLPGAGQVYLDQVGKGIVIAIAALFMLLVVMFFWWLILPLVLGILFWVWAVFDAYNYAQRSGKRRRY